MMQIIDTWVKTSFVCVCVFIMFGCDMSRLPPPTDEAIIAFYKKYSDELIEVVALCEKNTEIKQIWIDDEKVSFYNKKEPTADAIAGVAEIRAIISKLDIFTVQCSRSYKEALHFRGASFTLYAEGLSISGAAKGIDYDTPWSLSHSPYLQELIDSGGLKKINENGWFIFRE